MSISYADKIPNNVDLAGDRVLQRALEHWQPEFLKWWTDMGPEGSQTADVYLRTATSVHPSGWAHFDYVKMPEYRWGIFLSPADGERKVNFGDHKGEPVWQDVPGEHRANLRRIIVTQGDTEPASVEQQRHLGRTCPSLYDLRNLFQVNVEEGRHLWPWCTYCIGISAATAVKRPKRCCNVDRAIATIRGFWVPSTKERPIGWRFSCLPISRTAMENSNSWRWPNRASIHWRGRRASC
jgi:hypothetical protein